MSQKELNDFGNLYSNIETPEHELAEDILATVSFGMIREGFSEEAIISYLENTDHVDIFDKYTEVHENFENFILECEYAEYFGEKSILSEELELILEKGKSGLINTIKNQAGKLYKSGVNQLKKIGKPNKEQIELIKNAQKLNKGEKLSKWQQGRYNTAIKKGKTPDVALKFSKSKKEPSILGKASNFFKTKLGKGVKNTALVGTGVVVADKISTSDQAKKEGDKLVSGNGKRPVPAKKKPELLNKPETKPEIKKDSSSKVPVIKGGSSDGGSTTSGTIAQQDAHQQKVIAQFKKEQGEAKKAKERTDWLNKTKNSPAAKAGLGDDLRWKARQNHLKFQKDNNRGQFKAKTKEVPSKFAANKEKDTFKRRDSKLVAKGLKPPTYTKNVKVQEDVGPRLVKRALKNIPTELAPAAFMSGVLNKAKGLANKNTFIKGAIEGATGTTKLLRKVVTPPKGRKLTPNVKSTERISQGGALAVRKPSPSQKIKDVAGDTVKKVGETVKGTAEKLKKVKLKNPIPKPVTDYAVPVGVGVGIHKTLNREDYEPFELVLDYLVETQQVDSMEEALYVMMEMDQDAIYGIVQERSILPGKVPLQKPLKKLVKKTVETLKDKLHGGVRKPSTGKYTVKGGRKVKATQGAKQEGTFNTRQKDKLKAQQAAKPEAKAQADAAAKVNAPRSGVDVRKGKAPAKDVDARNMKGPKYENFDLLDENMKAKLAKNAVGKVMKAAKKMPEYVRDSIRRQYKAGTPGAAPYTIEDKKNVLNWYKNSK